LFGKTKQAYYKQLNSSSKSAIEEAMAIEVINKIRKRAKTKRWGGRKMHVLLKEELDGFSIKIGRDKLFDLLRENGMLVKPRKRKFFTTMSHHWLRKYKNLVENLVINRPNQLWVSDITYIKINGIVYYLYLITDAYSQKIVGFYISQNLKAESAVVALKIALKHNPGKKRFGLIHHSDRGIQYCSDEYSTILKQSEILISMTKPASPQENAIAERVNGILKDEWLYDLQLSKNEYPDRKIKKIISIYNKLRPHNSLGNLTPDQVHTMGFKRHKSERVIGKMYSYRKKAALKKKQLNNSNSNAIGPNGYSLVSCSPAELTYASPWHCKINTFEENK
jgi:transposase InsO family protein